MAVGVYEEQFRPWNPNHLVFDVDIHLSADYMVGSAHDYFNKGDLAAAQAVSSYANAALLANNLLDKLKYTVQGERT